MKISPSIRQRTKSTDFLERLNNQKQTLDELGSIAPRYATEDSFLERTEPVQFPHLELMQPDLPVMTPKSLVAEQNPSKDIKNSIFVGASVATVALGTGLLYAGQTPGMVVLGATLSVAGTLSGAAGIGVLASGGSIGDIFS